MNVRDVPRLIALRPCRAIDLRELRDTNTTFGAGQPGVGRRAIGELHEVLREFERELSVIGILTGEVGTQPRPEATAKVGGHRVTPRQHMDRERSLGLMAQLPNALEVSAKQYCGKRYEIDT